MTTLGALLALAAAIALALVARGAAARNFGPGKVVWLQPAIWDWEDSMQNVWKPGDTFPDIQVATNCPEQEDNIQVMLQHWDRSRVPPDEWPIGRPITLPKRVDSDNIFLITGNVIPTDVVESSWAYTLYVRSNCFTGAIGRALSSQDPRFGTNSTVAPVGIPIQGTLPNCEFKRQPLKRIVCSADVSVAARIDAHTARTMSGRAPAIATTPFFATTEAEISNINIEPQFFGYDATEDACAPPYPNKVNTYFVPFHIPLDGSARPEGRTDELFVPDGVADAAVNVIATAGECPCVVFRVQTERAPGATNYTLALYVMRIAKITTLRPNITQFLERPLSQFIQFTAVTTSLATPASPPHQIAIEPEKNCPGYYDCSGREECDCREDVTRLCDAGLVCAPGNVCLDPANVPPPPSPPTAPPCPPDRLSRCEMTCAPRAVDVCQLDVAELLCSCMQGRDAQLPIPAIVGGAVGGIVCLLLIFVVVFSLYKYQKREEDELDHKIKQLGDKSGVGDAGQSLNYGDQSAMLGGGYQYDAYGNAYVMDEYGNAQYVDPATAAAAGGGTVNGGYGANQYDQSGAGAYDPNGGYGTSATAAGAWGGTVTSDASTYYNNGGTVSTEWGQQSQQGWDQSQQQQQQGGWDQSQRGGWDQSQRGY